jgi:hypothetical protein
MDADRTDTSGVPSILPASGRPAEPEAQSSSPPEDGIDDPYQCAFCGRPTDPGDKRCPHCRRSLMFARPATVATGSPLRTAVFLITILLIVGLLEIGPPLFARLISRGADPGPFRVVLKTPGADLLLGRFLDWSGPVAAMLLTVAAARAVILLACLIGLSLRSAVGFYLTMGALVLDLLWSIYRYAGGYIGPAGAAADAVLALVTLAMLFAADRDFEVVRQRLVVRPDGGVRGGLAYHKRGHLYRRQGMWALAVAHWRLAVGASPREVQYYKDLGVGYAHIGRYERSLRALEEAARQAPEDGEVAEIIALVTAKRDAVGRSP